MQTFKPGDWITSYSEVQQVDKVSKDGKTLFFNSYKPVAYTDYWSSSRCSHWQPQPGEWCWFWDNEYNIDLRKFHRYSEEENIYFADNGVVYVSYNFCEPFIGQLPTILKE